MSDTEKMLIVDRIIADFWEWNSDEEERKTGALHVLNAISSVLGYEGADHDCQMDAAAGRAEGGT